jgi:D-amino-acid dehydrogenase
MEFSGINNRLDRRRIDAIVTGAKASFVPWTTPEIESEWAGMRPITADGLPVLDRAGVLDNTYIATGYAMQGVTLAPTSGRALAEMIATGERPALLEPFRLDRFQRVPLPRGARRRNGSHATA